ncbi:ComEC/Rec2 family competence protein [Corynebacterium pseudodiphtheriticum]|uniref:ComEC/Rec2 family competence protein n=1 Tax=Corynebacterium pseudodiphtheriticum TaxID=37637 RepID=A0ABT7FWT8_9CORY|nr:ComEC/Rec2 family competence protein [Corynebacterium pseudodiphtheriticum]MDC7068690.1 ComEC/Rec2 family competence protein [Corynebacterium pseudodiphtheriticum]MDC7084756.1 ComEC/Rec2 family competence protein [Corynebacterium pseudodiphtheriticum]MDC7086807.1 ComEC/Rec2 family competence protein [Corynebacterium pseudodiphtheriticum]MDK4290450.1 ComEC/Rec2 family competence protein [Corynebacterium pseudodiphtheriticum]MDK4328684.1 ComEC/Rec2 family competence protein [Corynebacterium p
MQDLRLLPSALTSWAVVLLVILTGGPGWAVVLLVVVGAVCIFTGHWQHAMLVVAAAGAALFMAATRQRRAAAFSYSEQLSATVAGRGTALEFGGYYFPVKVDGLAPNLALFTKPATAGMDADTVQQTARQTAQQPAGIAPGSQILVDATYQESARPGLAPVVARGEILEVQPPTGFAKFAANISDSLQAASQQFLGEHTAALVPGMVLGDRSAQTDQQRQMYIDAGLSHLTAVSGLHVATVVAAAVILARVARCGPVGQSIAALVVLAFYASVVGPAPSVLRASITGLVGVAAIVNSSRMPPIHALSIAVITLLLIDSDLAVTFGFALSVAATAGIIALVPLLYRPLARIRLPDVVVRAFAVSIAADIVTMPLVALMAGRVSVVSVLANVAVTPVVSIALLLGLTATILAVLPLPFPAEAVALKLAEPVVWWIYRVASWAQDLPLATIEVTPWAAAIAYGWIIVALLAGLVRTTIAVGITGMLFAGWLQRPPAPAEISPDNVLVIDELAEITDYSGQIAAETIPGNTEAIVVTDPSGRKADRPTATPAGIPIMFPNRDGPVTVYVDGSQRAESGKF